MEIKITYETLFEFLRREKSREELQKLDENFFSNVVEYLKEKESLMIKQRSTPDLFSFEDEKKSNDQLINIKKLIKELYERREKKIINIALNKSRTNSSIIDASSLLPEEKLMFDELIEHLNRYRLGILSNILQNHLPYFEKKEKTGDITQETETEEYTKKKKIIKFLYPVPKFVGPELDVYGPYEAEEIATLPEEVVRVLVEKKRAEEIKSE